MRIGRHEYIRVTRDVTCPICGKEDWCAISKDQQFVLCSRVADGSVKRYSFGHLHKVGDRDEPVKLPPRPKYRPPVNFKECMDRWDYGFEHLTELANHLGVSVDSLRQLGCGLAVTGEYRVFGFPMRNARHEIIGIKYRAYETGRKWCETGSMLGLYIPTTFSYSRPICIAEGESDTAALLTAGFNAIGRPSVNAGHALLTKFLTNRPIKIFVDRDATEIGLKEGRKLQHLLGGHARLVYNTNYKDAREWLLSGTLTESTIEENIVKDGQPEETNTGI